MSTSLDASFGSAERLAALRITGLLTAEPSESFDHLTRLAVRVLRVPMAFVNLIDEQRLVVLSCAPIASSGERQMPREDSLCQFVVATGEPFVVPDARAVPALASIPAVQSSIAAYAGVPLVSSGGEVLGAFCVADTVAREWTESDIHTLHDLAAAAGTEVERRTMMRRLAAHDAQYAELLDQTHELVVATDAAGRITLVNRAWRETLGYTSDEARALDPVVLVAPEHRATFLAATRRLGRGETVAEFEAVLVAKDGRRVVCRGHGTPRLEDGRLVGTSAVFRDVTEVRRAEHVRARLVATLEASTDVVAIISSDRKLLFLNRAGRRLIGLADDDDMHTVHTSRLRSADEDQRVVTEIIPAALRDGVWQGESTLLDVTGASVPVSLVVVAHPSTRPGEPPYFLSLVARDLRERMGVERAQRETEERFRAAIDASLDAFLLLRSVRDAEGAIEDFVIIDANARTSTLLGRPREAFVGHRLREALPSVMDQGHFADYVQVVATGAPVEREFETVTSGVSARWVRTQSARVGDGVAVMIRDVTGQRTAEVLRESERAFQRAVLENLSDGIVACDAHGQLTLFNRALREMHGLPAEDVPQEEWSEHYALFHADGVTPMAMGEIPLIRALRGEQVVDAEMVVAPRGMPPRTCLATGQQFYDATGHLLGAVVAMRDVTAQTESERALRDSEERFRTVVESLAEGLVITDLDGIATYVNQRMGEITGYAPEDLVGQDLSVLLMTPEARAPLATHLHDRRAGMGGRYSVEHLRRDGARVWVEIAGVPYRDGSGVVVGTVGSVTDISDRRRWESALLEAKEEAERANRSKTEFLSRASHELRTPLNSVIGFSTILLKNRQGTLGESDVSFVQRIRANGTHLLSLVDDLLDIAKVESGHMTKELSPVLPYDLVHDVVSTLEGRVLEKGITLAADVSLELEPLVTDAAKLKQVLINLVGNAIKFTDRGGVTVRVTGDGTGRARTIVVEDTGVGIPATDLPHVFDAFTQAESARQITDAGTGLGLAICKTFCDLLDYTLRVESTVGVGTRFIVEL